MRFKELTQMTLYMKIQEGFCCDWSEDDKFFVLTYDGIDIFHFRPNPKSRNEDPLFNRSFIFPVDYYPTDQTHFNMEMFCQISRKDTFTVLYDQLMFPRQKCANKPLMYFTKALWSPGNLIPNGNCILALLTVAGGVTLWIYKINEWVILADTSQMVLFHLRRMRALDISEKITTYVPDLKSMCYKLATFSMAWSNLYSDNGKTVLFFATVQKNGDIYIWRISTDNHCEVLLSTDLEIQVSTDLENVILAHWLHLSDHGFILILGTNQGTVHSINFSISSGLKLNYIKTAIFWSDEDNIKITHLKSVKWTSIETCIIIIKLSFFIVMKLDNTGNVTSTTYKSFAGLKITGIKEIADKEFIICGLTGIFFHIKLKSDANGNPEISHSPVETDINYSRYAQYGMCSSKNRAIWIMCLNPCKLMKKVSGRNSSLVVISHIQDMDPMKLILENESRLLTNQWDLMELTRIMVLKIFKELPTHWPVQLTEEMSIYEKKICMWLNIMSENEVITMEITPKFVKAILKDFSKQYVQNLHAKFVDEKSLTNSEKESLSMHVKFLKSFIKEKTDEKLSLLINVIEKEFNSVLKEFIQYCEWCYEELQGPTCSNNHSRQYCCITFRDISEKQTLLCFICGNSAHSDLFEQSPICTFCDSKFKYNALTTSEHVARTDNFKGMKRKLQDIIANVSILDNTLTEVSTDLSNSNLDDSIEIVESID